METLTFSTKLSVLPGILGLYLSQTIFSNLRHLHGHLLFSFSHRVESGMHIWMKSESCSFKQNVDHYGFIEYKYIELNIQSILDKVKFNSLQKRK